MARIIFNKEKFENIKNEFSKIENFDDLLNAGASPKIAAGIALFSAILLGGYFFITSSVQDEIATVKLAQDDLKNKYYEAYRVAANLKKYQQDYEDTQKSVETLLKQLPNKSNIDSLLKDVNNAGLGRGLVFNNFTPKNEDIKDNFYASLPIEMQIEGNFDAIATFGSDVAKLDRIVIFNKYSIKPISNPNPKTKNLNNHALSMTLTAETYRYLDADEMAAQQQKDKKEKGAK